MPHPNPIGKQLRTDSRQRQGQLILSVVLLAACYFQGLQILRQLLQGTP